MLNGYSPVFTTYEGGLYEMDLTRAAVQRFASFCSKLKPEISGTAKKYLEKNSFMTQTDYCRLTGLLKSAASRELREWIANPESGIDYKGRGTHKIYILKKQ